MCFFGYLLLKIDIKGYVRISLKDILTWISLRDILLRSVWICLDLFRNLFGYVSKSVRICLDICLDLVGYLFL